MKFSFFVITFSLFTFQLFGQSFAPVGAKWTFMDKKSSTPTPSPPCENKLIYAYEVMRQEQRNGKTVNVLESANSSFYYYEDSARVYFLENDSFYLLTDFSVSVGDTINNRIPENVTDFGADCACPPGFVGDIISVATWDTIQLFQGDSLRTIAFDALTDTSGALELVGKYDYTEKIGALGTNPFGPLSYPILICHTGFCCNDEKLCYSDDDFSYDFSALSNNCVYTSVSETRLSEIEMYPNPAHDQLTIQINQLTEDSKFYLYNNEGKKVLQQNLNQAQSTIDVSGLESGFYFYGIERDQKLIKKDRLIIMD